MTRRDNRSFNIRPHKKKKNTSEALKDFSLYIARLYDERRGGDYEQFILRDRLERIRSSQDI